jgi:hypothetical protein
MNTDDLAKFDEIVDSGLRPRTWYRFVHGQIDLLRSHVQGLEEQIDESIKTYGKEKVTTVVERDNDGCPFVVLEEYREIEGSPNDLEATFKYYFPNLIRRGTLISLFSFLEHQLDQLCDLFASTQRLNIVYTDLKDKGIDRSRRYLRKVIRLPLDDNSVDWQKLKKIQGVRNIVVHNNAVLDDDTMKDVKKIKYLSSHDSETYDFRDIHELNVLEGLS